MRILAGAFRLYFFALALGLRTIKAGLTLEGVKLLLAPVGYWRFLPNAFVWQQFLHCENPKILDVASPKLLSVLLASKTQSEVHATDLDDEKIFTRWGRIAGAIDLKNYLVEYQDARRLTYPDESFDLVYSISVIEHIPEDGDMLALGEFQRVLKPNGILVIEVPYRRQREVILAKYDSKGKPTKQPQFYERHYDADLLRERLETPGLRIEKKLILGEWLPVDRWIVADRLPRFLRVVVLPFEPWLAALNYWARPTDRAGRPLAALIVYRKL